MTFWQAIPRWLPKPTITNNSSTDRQLLMIVCAYDANHTLKGVKVLEATVAAHTQNNEFSKTLGIGRTTCKRRLCRDASLGWDGGSRSAGSHDDSFIKQRTGKNKLTAERTIVMQCGFYETEITPPLGTMIPGYFTKRVNQGVKQKLYAKAAVLENEGQDGCRLGCRCSNGTGRNAGLCQKTGS